MSTFTSPFTGTMVSATQVTYQALSFSSNVLLAWPSFIPLVGGYTAISRIMDLTPTANGLSIALPPGNQGTQGADALFRNFGAFAVTVTDVSGGNSFSVPAGAAYYIYLVDNSTFAGVWNNFQFGAGTSTANASSLVGPGLTTTSAGRLATTESIVELSVAPTLVDANRALVYVWTGGVAAFPLPVAASITPGWYISVRNGGSGTLTITPTAPSTVNGVSTQTMNPGESGIIVFNYLDGNFFIIGQSPRQNVNFSAATYDVDAIVGNTISLVANAPIIQNYVALSGTRSATLAVTLPATTQLYVLLNNTGHAGYNVTFQVSGSVQSPLSLATGTFAIVLSDGSSLYLLTTAGISTFFAANGTAGAPSFSFINDLTTGMYLVSTAQLGLTAGGVQMMNLNNSNPSAPLVTSPAEFRVGLIDGGVF